MWDALKLLGYIDCYHMFNLMIDPDDNDMWIDAINGKFFSHLGHKPFEKKDWDQLLGHCQVRSDDHICHFCPTVRLTHLFPGRMRPARLRLWP